MTLQALIQKYLDLCAQQEAVLNVATAATRGLTADESTKFQNLQTEIDALNTTIEQVKAVEARKAADAQPAGAATRPDIKVGNNLAADKPWASFGEQLQAIVKAGSPGQGIDARLLKPMDAASGGSATVPSDGGFMIQTDFSTAIFQRAYETGQLASRCDLVEIGPNSNGVAVPYVDETSRATGSRWGGVQVYRAGETDAVGASKPKIGKLEIKLSDLKGLAYASDELLQDASAMNSIYSQAFSEEFAWVLDDEIFGGAGGEQCLGITNCPALVTVAKEAGQAGGTINYQNVVKMRARMWARSRANMVWFYNQDIEPQLHTMSIAIKNVAGTENVGGVPVYMPAGGVSGQPYDTLYGRPMIPIEQASTLGTVGDLVLADLTQYALIRKGGLQADASMHVRFVYDEMCFRFKMRVNGQPKWKQALTPAKGANTLSPFVALQTR